MRSRIAISTLLSLALASACGGRVPAERAVAGRSDAISPTDFAAENLEISRCPPLPVVDGTAAHSHAVAPGAHVPLPTRFRADSGGDGVQRWSDGRNASVEIWHSAEPEEGMATSGPTVRVGDIAQCSFRVAGAFAKMYRLALNAPGEPDTTYLALVYAYPRSGFAFNIAIETRQQLQRDSLVAFVRQLVVRD